MEYNVFEDDIQIVDSYKIVLKDEMIEIINQIKEKYPENPVIKNVSLNRMVREWQSHNLLYNLNLFREHTKDVDINDNNFIMDCGYFILSMVYRIFN